MMKKAVLISAVLAAAGLLGAGEDPALLFRADFDTYSVWADYAKGAKNSDPRQSSGFRSPDLQLRMHQGIPGSKNSVCLTNADVFHTEGGIVFWTARSRDGVHFAFDPKPVAMPECSDGWEENGVYDPRITEMDGVYYIVYNSHNNRRGTRLAIMKTTDFQNYEHVSFVSGVNNRNGALFPERINGLYCCFNRPFAGDEKTPCAMEMSFSPDLVFWGRNRESLAPRAAHWDGMKLGIGAPPLRIDEGWLIIYHGVVDSSCGSIYSLSAAILDYREPWKVLARTNKPVLFPEAPYEKQGRVTNTVFSCNALRIGDNIRMYYGAADAVICMAEMPLADLVKACHEPYRYMMHY